MQNDSNETRNSAQFDDVQSHFWYTPSRRCSSRNCGLREVLVPTKGRIEEVQTFVYMFLERPTGMRCFVYNVAVLLVIMFSLMFTWLCSIPRLDLTLQPYTLVIDSLMIAYFGSEYIVRIWSSGCRQKYSGCRGRLRFMAKPLCMLDLLAVLSLVGCIFYPVNSNGVYVATDGVQYRAANLLIVRGLRFFQIGRLFHLDRYVTSWRILLSVFNEHLFELITTVYFAFVVLVIGSYLLWMAERTNPQLGSMADALYCTLITMATIGYGDKVPITSHGRVIISTVGIVGVFLWALPAGIIGSGFALKVREERKKHRFNQLLPMAAALIQTRWRMCKSRSTYVEQREKPRSSYCDDESESDRGDHQRASGFDFSVHGRKVSSRSVGALCIIPALVIAGQHPITRTTESLFDPWATTCKHNSTILSYFVNLIKYSVSRRKFSHAWRRHHNHIYAPGLFIDRNIQSFEMGSMSTAYSSSSSSGSTTTIAKIINATSSEMLGKLAALSGDIREGFARVDLKLAEINSRIESLESRQPSPTGGRGAMKRIRI
ncbi:hypothetical protein ACOME3_002620 [Neoechinorhynchus agilis]